MIEEAVLNIFDSKLNAKLMYLLLLHRKQVELLETLHPNAPLRLLDLANPTVDVSTLTAPALTLLLLAVVVGLGAAFVWMLWEIERASKPRRDRDRSG